MIPNYLIWAYYLSFMNYALNGMAIIALSGPTRFTQQYACYVCTPSTTPCPPDTIADPGNASMCCTASLSAPVAWPNDEALAYWGFGSQGAVSTAWGNILVLIGMALFFRILSYLTMRFVRVDKR